MSVAGSFETILADYSGDRTRYERALREADIVLTVTGRNVLDRVVDLIGPAMNIQDKKQWLLFCENGLDVAATYASRFDSSVVAMDTVMSACAGSRMTKRKHTNRCGPGLYRRLLWRITDFLPLDIDKAQDGPFSPKFTLVTHEEFLCWEYIKFYMHNGAHAFVSYHAHLEGTNSCLTRPDGFANWQRR